MMLVERGARRLPALAALERRIDRELDRLEHRDRHLREPAAGAPVPCDRRVNGVCSRPSMRTGTIIGVGLVGDQAGAVIDLHQAAGDGDAAFRKDDQRVAGLAPR